jgi:hypothetical protein
MCPRFSCIRNPASHMHLLETFDIPSDNANESVYCGNSDHLLRYKTRSVITDGVFEASIRGLIIFCTYSRNFLSVQLTFYRSTKSRAAVCYTSFHSLFTPSTKGDRRISTNTQIFFLFKRWNRAQHASQSFGLARAAPDRRPCPPFAS